MTLGVFLLEPMTVFPSQSSDIEVKVQKRGRSKEKEVVGGQVDCLDICTRAGRAAYSMTHTPISLYCTAPYVSAFPDFFDS